MPSITITDAAAKAFANARAEGSEKLRLEIGPNYEYDLLFDAPQVGDVVVTNNGATLRMSQSTAQKADGLRIDYLESANGSGFKLESPHQRS